MSTRKSFLMFLAILVIVAGGCSNEQDSSDQGGTVEAIASELLPIDGMQNITRLDNVTVGAQPTPAGMAEAVAQGYTIIVSNRGPGEISWDEQLVADSLGIQYVNMPITGPDLTITDEQVNQLDQIISAPGANVLLHCASGNRASGLWATWMVEKRGMDPEKALELAGPGGLSSIRPVVEERLGLEQSED